MSPQKANLFEAVLECLHSGSYSVSAHAMERMEERDIVLTEVLFVIKNGRRNLKKDIFDTDYNAWNYAIDGKTKDRLHLRVIVSFDSTGLLIITVINI